jgi:hypothetical protein
MAFSHCTIRENMKSITLRIVASALGLRLVTAFVAFLINAVVPMAEREQFTVFPSTNVFWDTFARFDSGWYFNIARYGYEWVEGGRSNLAFFPLYPMMMRSGWAVDDRACTSPAS